jgi:hypothetical protein
VKFILTLVLALSVFAFAAAAEEFKGVVADSHCAKAQPSKVTSPEHAKCAEKCIKGGAKAVLVTEDGKVYNLDDQQKAVPHAGKKVTVNGTLDGDTIKLSSIQAS